MMIEVFGPGCMRCEQTAQVVMKVISESGRDDIGFNKISRLEMITARGVMMTPAVAVDGVIKCQGKVPTEAEVRGWLEE
ncbi:MAG TPA: thioredoxin family protein [Acidobacteriota bacterium]|nr:thioredoxin family protein [Acidobacteriota bacterium]